MNKNVISHIGLILSLLAIPAAYAQNTVTVNSDQTVSINGSKVFPISVYMQSDWAGVKALGVNTVSRPFCVNASHFANAQSSGLYLHYTAGPGCDYENATAIKNRNASSFTASVNQVKNANYLFGYGLPDEPKSATGLSAADTKWAYDVIKAADPTRPVFLTEYASDISVYKDSADIFLNDQYPFNNNLSPMYDIKTKVVNMRNQVAPKPVWLIIQTGSQFGMPTNAQIRAETYLSIALGATGMVFYSYDVVDAGGEYHIKKDGDIPFMKNLITELKNFSPVFLGAKNNNLSYSSSHIDAILKNYNGKSYLIAVNKAATAQSITFTLNGFGNATAKIGGLANAGSTRTGQILSVSSSGVLSDTLQPLEAVIYEISAQPSQQNGMTSPTANGIYNLVSGVPVTFNVDSSVARILLYSSDAWTNVASLTPPFNYTWFPSAAGGQVLKYEFYDSNWNFIAGSSGSRNLTVNGSINTYFISPVTNNPVVSGEIHAGVFASDPNVGTQNGSGIQSILFELYKGSTLVSSRLESQSTYDWYLNTTAFANGLYTLKATVKSTAAAGNDTNIISIPITITN